MHSLNAVHYCLRASILVFKPNLKYEIDKQKAQITLTASLKPCYSLTSRRNM